MSEPVSLRGMVAELGARLEQLERENAELKIKLAAVGPPPIDGVIDLFRKAWAARQVAQVADAAEAAFAPAREVVEDTQRRGNAPAPPPPVDNWNRCSICGGILIGGQCADCEERQQMEVHSRPKAGD